MNVISPAASLERAALTYWEAPIPREDDRPPHARILHIFEQKVDHLDLGSARRAPGARQGMKGATLGVNRALDHLPLSVTPFHPSAGRVTRKGNP
ncbi:hypothetical protein [Streptomyces mirabilis]|uniref:hypothetical protein n=1 Tax=Streptomyces mirabilis TaxID=68239 RepID=UPI0036F01F71